MGIKEFGHCVYFLVLKLKPVPCRFVIHFIEPHLNYQSIYYDSVMACAILDQMVCYQASHPTVRHLRRTYLPKLPISQTRPPVRFVTRVAPGGVGRINNNCLGSWTLTWWVGMLWNWGSVKY